MAVPKVRDRISELEPKRLEEGVSLLVPFRPMDHAAQIPV
jgi:hypothetical protein